MTGLDHPFTEEQRQLQAMVQRLIAERYDQARRRAIVASDAGWSRALWREFADLGLLAIPFEERHGGLGGGGIETLIVMGAFGRGLVVEPYLETVVLVGGLLRHGATSVQQNALIPKIASGEKIYALAFAEPRGRFNLLDLATTATRVADGWRLEGHKAVVYAAPWADGLFVTAKVECGGLGVFHVATDAAGLKLQPYPTVDGRRAAEVILDGVVVGDDDRIGALGEGEALIERVIDEAIAAVCAEAAGAMQALNERTLDYCHTRVTFGRALASYQVLQHRLVDMHVAQAYAASTALMAALKLDADPRERARAASIAKYHACRDGRFVGQNAIQLHGAIGMTDELDVGHYFKRLTVIDFLFGNADHHLRRYAGLNQMGAAA